MTLDLSIIEKFFSVISRLSACGSFEDGREKVPSASEGALDATIYPCHDMR